MVYQLSRTIAHFFPDLVERLKDLQDPRSKSGTYDIAELVGACIAMFLLKQGSRNAMNDCRYEGKFARNYFRVFRKLRLPHMDTVNQVMRRMREEELEELKATFVRVLIAKKVFHSSRFLGKYFCVAVDGSGVFSFSERHCDQCLTKTIQEESYTLGQQALRDLRAAGLPKWILDCLKALIGHHFKTEIEFFKAFEKEVGTEGVERYQGIISTYLSFRGKKVVYSHQVLEAKLVTEQGFSISLASEWIENPDEEFNKQDCEQKAFRRLAKKLKKHFPRLPICLVVDGLYPNEPFFTICHENQWEFIAVLKDDSLLSLQEEIKDLTNLNEQRQRSRQYQQGARKIAERYQWLNALKYRHFQLNWIEMTETLAKETFDSAGSEETTATRFVFLVSQVITDSNCFEVIKVGRRRWKIENEGFNCQKNLGYELQHKYSRTSLLAAKNYYQCLQIAHMLNQLCEFAQATQDKVKQWKSSLKHLWKTIFACFVYETIDEQELEAFSATKVQFRHG